MIHAGGSGRIKENSLTSPNAKSEKRIWEGEKGQNRSVCSGLHPRNLGQKALKTRTSARRGGEIFWAGEGGRKHILLVGR